MIIKTQSRNTVIVRAMSGLGQEAMEQTGKYNAFLGISVPHCYFSNRIVEQYMLWGSETFRQFNILLMDDPERYNYQVFEQLSLVDAIAKATDISHQRKRGFQKSINRHRFDNVRILQFRDFINHSLFQNILNILRGEIRRLTPFKHSMLQLMDEVIGNKIRQYQTFRKWSEVELAEKKEVLLNYLVEELASVIFFTENGYPIEIDPTHEFSTKTLLYEDGLSGLSQKLGLTRRGHLHAFPEGYDKSKAREKTPRF